MVLMQLACVSRLCIRLWARQGGQNAKSFFYILGAIKGNQCTDYYTVYEERRSAGAELQGPRMNQGQSVSKL